MEILKRFTSQEMTGVIFLYLSFCILFPAVIYGLLRVIVGSRVRQVNKFWGAQGRKLCPNDVVLPASIASSGQKLPPKTQSLNLSNNEKELESPSSKPSLNISKLLSQSSADGGKVINQPKSISEALRYVAEKAGEDAAARALLNAALRAEAAALPARTRHSAARLSALLLASSGGPNVEKFSPEKVQVTQKLISQATEIFKIQFNDFQTENQLKDTNKASLDEQASYISYILQEQLENEFWAPQADSLIHIIISKIIAIANGISRLKLNLAAQNTMNSIFTTALLMDLPDDVTLVIQDINGEELYPLSFIDAAVTAKDQQTCYSSRYQVGNEQKQVITQVNKSPSVLQGKSPRALKEILQLQSPTESLSGLNQLTEEEALERFPWLKHNIPSDKDLGEDKTVYNVITRNSKGGFVNIFGQFAPNDTKQWGQWIMPQCIRSLAHYGNTIPLIRQPQHLVSLQLTRCMCPNLSQLSKLQTLSLSYIKNVDPQQLQELKELQIFFAYNIQILNKNTAGSIINSPSLTQSRLAYGSQVVSNQDLTKSQLESSHLQTSNYMDSQMCPQKTELLTNLYYLPQLKRVEIYNCHLSKSISINTMPTGSQTSSMINTDIFQSLEILILRYNACLRNVSIRVGDGALKKLKTIDTTAKLSIENQDKLEALEYIYSKNLQDQDVL